MSVKKADRHVSKSESLGKSRYLIHQLMILTHPAIQNDDGSVIKPGLLGAGQPLYAFGNDLFHCGKQIHACCYKANEITLKDNETLDNRNLLHKKAIDYCDSILRLIDLCIFEYAQNNKKKRKSFLYVAKLTKETKDSLYDRMNRDKLILEHKMVNSTKKARRYR